MRGILLVHGAHVGPACWEPVASELRNRSHRVEAVGLHRGSLAADTLAVQEVVAAALNRDIGFANRC